MDAGRQRVVEAAVELLGPTEVLADLSWPHGESVVLDLWSGGRRVVGKAYRQPAKFVNERFVYERWVPAIADRAPALLGADPSSHVLLFSHLAGQPATSSTPELHRRAGALLARFHAAADPVPMDDYLDAQRQRLADWVARARPWLLDDAVLDTVRRLQDATLGLPDPLGVPCHRDWQPRNWLVGDDGEPWAIDFEHARVAPWFEDVQRLWWQEWRDAPELADAFFAGYGRVLDEAERRWFDATSALWHLTTVVWADEHDDDSFADRARAALAAMAKRT